MTAHPQLRPLRLWSAVGCLRLAVRKLVVASFCLALAGGGLASGSAHALVVNVRGEQWRISTFTGSYNENREKFAIPAFGGSMPWIDDSGLSGEFTKAVGLGLGFPNELKCSGGSLCYHPWPFEGAQSLSFAPLFVEFGYITVGDGGIYKDYLASYGYLQDDGIYDGNVDYLIGNIYTTHDISLTWAQATRVPAPLPILAVASAFRASRRLKKRMKS